MSKSLLVVISSPKPGQEDEYNRWYTDQHLRDVLKLPGFVSAQRFRLASNTPNGVPGTYLALYEYESDGSPQELQRAFTLLQNATQSGQIVISQAMDSARVFASLFAPITEKLRAAQ